MPKCPNYLLCNGNENEYSGTCYRCYMSIFGFYQKQQMLKIDRTLPNTYNDIRFLKYKLNDDDVYNWLHKLYDNDNKTGILKIKEQENECCVCYNICKIFIAYPTCNIHYICIECFKLAFYNYNICKNITKEIDVNNENYKIFDEFIYENYIIENDNNDITNLCDIYIQLHGNKENDYKNLYDYIENNLIDKENSKKIYNCLYKYPNNKWCNKIKNIYDECSKYKRIETINYYIEDKYPEKFENLKKCCPICRCDILHICDI